MKSIGVLGGIGPQATMDLVARLHRIAQERIPSQANSCYPPIIVQYFCQPPILFDEDGRPTLPLQPDPRFLEAARSLGMHANFIIISANGPHAFLEEIEEASGVLVISMIDAAIGEVASRNWSNVSLLSLGEPRVYQEALDRSKMTYQIIQGDLRDRLDAAIFRVMEGWESSLDAKIAQTTLTYLREKGVDGVILGCTEIPLLLELNGDEEVIINPGQFLTVKAIEVAIL